MRIDHAGLDVRIEGPDAGHSVLLHGMASCAETYDFFPPELPDHPIVRLVRFDRGHGRSDRAPDASRRR